MAYQRGSILAFVGLALAISLCLSGYACAAKQAQKPTRAAPTVEATPAAVSTSALEDIIQGLVDFEKRASRYNQDEWNFVLGYAHYRHGNWKDADGYLKRVEGSLPIVSDYILFYQAVVANRQGKDERALDLLDALKRSYPESVWITESMLERARALIALRRYGEARASLNDYRKSARDDGSFDANVLIARSYIEEGDETNALSVIRSVAISSGSERELGTIAPLIDDVRKRFSIDIRSWLDEPAQQLRLAESFAARSQWGDVASRLEKLVARHKLSPTMDAEVKWLLARAYRSIHRYDEAIRLMEGLLGNPNARGIEETILNTLATTYTKNNDYTKAIALRRRMMDRAPVGSARATQMAYKIAFLVMDEGKYDEAIPLWRQALAIRGGHRYENARWYLAWCHYMAGRYQGALDLMNGMLKGMTRRSDIHDRLLYWKGRVLERLGQKGLAYESFRRVIGDHPNGYYAELAERRLKGDVRSTQNFAIVSGGGHSGAGSSHEIGDVGGSYHMSRAAFFDKLGLHEEAARELGALPAGSEDTIFALASRNFAHDVAYRIAVGRYHHLLKASSPGLGVRREVWEAAYPRAYDPLVMRVMRGGAIDPMLIWAIMLNESSFRPEVISPAGAIGLMQLIPDTANRLANDVGREKIDRRDLYCPSTNIALGIAYFKKLAAMFPQNPVAWIASYNAGEEAVTRWIANGPVTDIEEWIEEIPYKETNLYVKKVLNSYWRYRRLYAH